MADSTMRQLKYTYIRGYILHHLKYIQLNVIPYYAYIDVPHTDININMPMILFTI